MAKFGRGEIRKIIGDACTDEMENALVALHLGVLDPLKDELEKAKAEAEKVATLEAKLAEAENGDYKTKFESERKAFEDYKKTIDAEKSKAAKEAAARKYLEEKGVKGANLEIAMRGARDEIAGLELDGEKIKDAKSLDDLLSGTYKGLIVTETEKGVDVAHPAGNTGGRKTVEEIMAIKDTSERQKAIFENRDLFGIK